MAAHNELGQWGEQVAADYLQAKGYTVVVRNWKSGHRDIDIVALDGETLVIVEVKTRRNRLFADPESAVDSRKISSIRQAANHYVKLYHADQPVRFDIVTVTGVVGSMPQIEHIEDAF